MINNENTVALAMLSTLYLVTSEERTVEAERRKIRGRGGFTI